MRIIVYYQTNKGKVEVCGMNMFLGVLPIHCRKIGMVRHEEKEYEVFCELAAFGWGQVPNTRISEELRDLAEKLVKDHIRFPMVIID